MLILQRAKKVNIISEYKIIQYDDRQNLTIKYLFSLKSNRWSTFLVSKAAKHQKTCKKFSIKVQNMVIFYFIEDKYYLEPKMAEMWLKCNAPTGNLWLLHMYFKVIWLNLSCYNLLLRIFQSYFEKCVYFNLKLWDIG